MDTSKIGNARQQDDNLKAVPNAKPLGDCCQELIGLIEKQIIEPGEKNARMAQFYSGLTNLDSPHGQDWLDRTLTLESATLAILEAIKREALTVWYVEHSEPTSLAPGALESGSVRHGIYKAHEHPAPEMQGAKLWVKTREWRQFLSTFALGKGRDTEGDHFRVGHTFTRDDPATIAPWWTVNQSLAWIVSRTPSYVEYIGNLETDEPREHRPYIVHAICESQVAESDEGKVFMESRRAGWPKANILAHAGRALLDKILAGQVRPLAREQGQGRQMRSEEFVGIGARETGSDWLDLDPQPLFSSAEMMAAFAPNELVAAGENPLANIRIAPREAGKVPPELPPWLNPYQLVAWVQYRDLAMVAKAKTFNGLAAQHMYGTESRVGSIVDLERALQEGRLTAHGLTNSGETFVPIPAVEWTRVRLAPLDLARQHPYVRIQVKREDALALFPSLTASEDSTPPCSRLPAKKRRKPGPAPDPDWPAAIAKVAADCIQTGYARPLKRGEKAAIQNLLLNAMAEKNKHPSDDSARRYADEVIARLPDNSA